MILKFSKISRLLAFFRAFTEDVIVLLFIGGVSETFPKSGQSLIQNKIH